MKSRPDEDISDAHARVVNETKCGTDFLQDGNTAAPDARTVHVRRASPPERDELLDEYPVRGAPDVEAHLGHVGNGNCDGVFGARGVLRGSVSTAAGVVRVVGSLSQEGRVALVAQDGLPGVREGQVGVVVGWVVGVRGLAICILEIVSTAIAIMARDSTGQSKEDLRGEAAEVGYQRDLRWLLAGVFGVGGATACGGGICKTLHACQ